MSVVEAAPLRGTGFYAVEHDGEAPFRWSEPRFQLTVSAGFEGFVSLRLASPVAGRVLELDLGAAGRASYPLASGWQTLDLPVSATDWLGFSISPFSAAGDKRQFGVMLRDALFHADQARHEKLALRQANGCRNEAEFLAGVEVLHSVPTHLRVTMSKRCNIANETPCVYCSWDWAKRLEQGSPDFSAAFISRMGRFLDAATAVNDCSYGEPPLEPHFGAVVEMLTDGGRLFEFTSNGQTLSVKNRAKLLGRTARVHVSIDAATAAGYNRYRDHRFELIINNLRALCSERRATGNLPELYVSFIVMRSNVDDIPAFISLMADIGVDRVTFRTLYLEDHLDVRRLEHYGVQFDYDVECLGVAELIELGPRCRELGAAAGISVGIEWDEFVRNHGPTRSEAPICSEPWRTAYFLDRGLMPCCYGREPIVRWADVAQDDLEAGLVAAFNSEPYRALRRDLAAGRLGEYCQRTRGCPIVKVMRQPRPEDVPATRRSA